MGAQPAQVYEGVQRFTGKAASILARMGGGFQVRPLRQRVRATLPIRLSRLWHLRFHRIANKGPGSPDPVTWVYHPGMVPEFEWSDSALDRDLKILPFGFARHDAPPPRPPPPAHERFWLTEEELTDPGLRAQ